MYVPNKGDQPLGERVAGKMNASARLRKPRGVRNGMEWNVRRATGSFSSFL